MIQYCNFTFVVNNIYIIVHQHIHSTVIITELYMVLIIIMQLPHVIS